jgi:hypothetical protein
MRSLDGPGLRSLAAIAGMFCLALSLACQKTMTSGNPPAPRRDINAVLAAHDRELLARPGVVGVYVGLMADEKTPCLKVMLAKKDPELERSLPTTLEGYPVVTEVTGEIKPLNPG